MHKWWTNMGHIWSHQVPHVSFCDLMIQYMGSPTQSAPPGISDQREVPSKMFPTQCIVQLSSLRNRTQLIFEEKFGIHQYCGFYHITNKNATTCPFFHQMNLSFLPTMLVTRSSHINPLLFLRSKCWGRLSTFWITCQANQEANEKQNIHTHAYTYIHIHIRTHTHIHIFMESINLSNHIDQLFPTSFLYLFFCFFPGILSGKVVFP